VACKHLKLHLGYRDELKLCSEIIAEILIHLHDVQQQGLDKVATTIQHDLNTLCSSILDVLLKTILIIMEGSPSCLTSLVAVTLGLLQQLDESHYKYLWDGMTQGDYKEMKDFLHRSLLVFKELLSQNWQVSTSSKGDFKKLNPL
jgi:dedicator of cytokinesis protein 3